ELVFLERPREGPVHCYETLRPSAGHPRRVPTKPADHYTSAAWVCPQFETTNSVVLKSRQKQHCSSHKPQNRDANHTLLGAGGACQKATACKFPPLTFENSEGYAVHPLAHPNRSRKNTPCSRSHPEKGAVAKANAEVNSSENCRKMLLLTAPQPVEPEVCSPSDVETLQVPSPRNPRCSSTTPQNGSHAWHPENELAFDTRFCGRGESAAVLVTDTPEHEYGVKVTWRRRPHLMKYLRDTG
ncbi:RHNO1 protein, partial [Baryphthengus martii]|nr:RHNO1 protein [Baryphthengus martii]